MVQDTINLRVKGQDIIDAVKKVAKDPVEERRYIDGRYVFVVGQVSHYPYKNLIVKVADEGGIDPEKIYDQIIVAKHSWGGMVYIVAYGEDKILIAVKILSNSLRYELADKVQSDNSINAKNKLDTARLRKAAKAVYLATDEVIAEDLSNLLNSAANEIDFLRSK